MGSPCLFTRQQALKMGYFYCFRAKKSNHLNTELSLVTSKTQNFILKIKLRYLHKQYFFIYAVFDSLVVGIVHFLGQFRG